VASSPACTQWILMPGGPSSGCSCSGPATSTTTSPTAWGGSASSAARIAGIYDRNAGEWLRLRGRRLIERHWLAAFLRALPGDRVLDLGCGTGVPMAAALIARGCRVTGVDAAPGMVRRARARFREGRWLVADMRALPALGRFDGILAWHSFFHLPAEDQARMVRTFRRHAAPGAVVMFTSGTECGEAIGRLGGEALYHASLATGDYRALLAAQGFRLLRHVEQDRRCGGATVWMARWGGRAARANTRPSVGTKTGARRRPFIPISQGLRAPARE